MVRRDQLEQNHSLVLTLFRLEFYRRVERQESTDISNQNRTLRKYLVDVQLNSKHFVVEDDNLSEGYCHLQDTNVVNRCSMDDRVYKENDIQNDGHMYSIVPRNAIRDDRHDTLTEVTNSCNHRNCHEKG